MNAHQRRSALRAAIKEFPRGAQVRGVGGLWRVVKMVTPTLVCLAMEGVPNNRFISAYRHISIVRKMHRES